MERSRFVSKEHEKFWAFMMLGGSVLLLALLAYFYPPEDGSGAQRIIDAAVGGLLLALGSAANALFRIKEQSELDSVQNVRVSQPAADPVPVTPTSEPAADADVLPPEARVE